MDFSLSPEEEAFRTELRAWLAMNLPDHRKVYPPSDDELSLHPDKSFDACRVWHRRLYLGRLHAGWGVAITILMYERMSLGSLVGLHQYVDRLLDLSRRHAGAATDPRLRQRLADLYIASRALRLTNLRYMTRELGGQAPGAEGSVLKLIFTDAYKQMAEIATQIMGLHHQIWGNHPRATDGGRWAFQALFANRFGIAGGTDQIQRSIIGERLLGLPR